MKNDLKALRKRAKLTQQQMAEELGEKVATYGTWERGTTTMSAAQLLRCAEILECSTDAILCHDIPKDFDDPMEEALHMTWRDLKSPQKRCVLKYAQEQLALQQLGGGVGTAPGDGPPAVSETA